MHKEADSREGMMMSIQINIQVAHIRLFDGAFRVGFMTSPL
jgi:hypothetical protein